MFDPAANTPEHTSWTKRLLARLNQAIGPGVMERPIFPMSGPESSAALGNSETLADVGSGKYDNLFQGAPDKPSDLYRAAQKRPPIPTVQLISISPIRPEVFAEPDYPPLARLAHIEGVVVFKADIEPNGHPANFMVESGHPMLRGVVENAVSMWQFPKVGANQKVRGTIEFKTNCALENK
jgi:outer membrane biosynthesis protein TonB